VKEASLAGRIGTGVLAGFVILAVAGPALAGYRVHALAGRPLQPPSGGHWLGTNAIGRT
jgi:ABC-type dipeptide/oligopeptide/nickel transport system permease subunit